MNILIIVNDLKRRIGIRRSIIRLIKKIAKINEGDVIPKWLRIIEIILFPIYWLRQDRWYDGRNDIFTIYGIRYSAELFRAFSEKDGIPLNEPFMIIKRDNGMITIKEIKE